MPADQNLPQPVPNIRPKSGESGYDYGQPILAGFPDSTAAPARAVFRLRDGLPVVGADERGRCNPNALGRVAFGYSQDASCGVPLTQAGLRDFCTGITTARTVSEWLQATAGGGAGANVAPPGPAPGTAAPLPLQLMGGFLFQPPVSGTAEFGPYAGLPVLVSKWADADQNNINNWRTDPQSGQVSGSEIAPLAPPAAMRYVTSSAGMVCRGVTTGLNYTIVTAYVGAATNPQNVISYVKAR